jgi:alginate biosynthesis protein AlgX
MKHVWETMTGKRLLAAGLALALPFAVQADEGQLYKCPFLHDGSMQLLSPMTQGKEGWFFRAGDMVENYALLPETKGYLTRVAQAFKHEGSDLILVAVPPRSFSAEAYLDATQPMQATFDARNAEANYRNFLQSLSDTGAQVVDLLDVAAEYDDEHGMHFFFKRDNHWTPFGAKLSAEKIARVLEDYPAYSNAERGKYVTTNNGELRMREEMALEIQRLCTSQIPAEIFPGYTTAAEAGVGEDALFGDEGQASPLVLLGSSYSATPDFNFDGFLEETTGLPVANYAISAGQLFNSIISYVSLPKDQRQDPDFILWEDLAHYDYNRGERQFRQIIPAIYGECDKQSAVAVESFKAAPKAKHTLFTFDPEKKISGDDYYLFINSDNLGFVQFTLEMEYQDGDGEWFTIDRSQNFNNSGRFFVELTDEITAPLTQINIEALSDVEAEVEVRLCRLKDVKNKTAKNGEEA